MTKKAALAGGVALLGMLAPLTAHATTISGTIQFACVSPTSTVRGITPQGKCGYLITFSPPLSGGVHFTLTPSKPADLDIGFYDATNTLLDAYAGTGPEGTGCSGFSNLASAGAVKAVVVATPSTCATTPGWAPQGSEYNIGFTYTSW